jgi:hypothetical protein
MHLHHKCSDISKPKGDLCCKSSNGFLKEEGDRDSQFEGSMIGKIPEERRADGSAGD